MANSINYENTVDDFNENLLSINVAFSCFNLNIASLNKHHEELKDLLSAINLKFSIINLCEIRNVNLEQFSNLLPGYSYTYNAPKDKITGGVAMFINSNLNYSILSEFSFQTPFIDILTIKITFPNRTNILVCNIYRHHSISIKTFIEKLQPLLEKFNLTKMSVIIVGDFNINLFNTTSCQIKDFNETMVINNFFQGVKSATRITQNTATLIDHVYYKNFEFGNVTTGTLLTDISDHLSTFFILKGNKLLVKNERITNRIYSENNLNKFSVKLPSTILESFNFIANNSEDSKKCWNFFIDKIRHLIDNTIPRIKSSRSTQRDKAWMNPEIKKECRLKDRFYKKYIKNKTEYRYENYVRQKRKVNNMICKAKKTYYENFFDKDVTNKNLWNFIKLFKSNKETINKITIESKTISDPRDICTAFNNYFSSIGPTLASKFKEPSNFTQYLNEKINTQFYLRNSNCTDIKEIIKSLKNSSSVGFDDISLKLIKPNADMFSIILSPLINMSIRDGYFPSNLKIAKIIPIFKKGSKSNLSNYRPISILSNLSKIFEKFLCERLTEYFQKNNLFYKNQFGFRKFHNTTQALMSVHDFVCNSLNDKKKTMGIFLDLSKAFDTVDKNILLHKLKYYGIKSNELSLLSSFLANRKQITCLNDIFSDHKETITGVPQGSILAPLLFLIYINDIKYFNSSDINIKLFADDTNIFIKSNSFEELFTNATFLLNNLSKWLKSNKLSLNYDKTEYVIFGNHKFDCSLNLKIDNNVIKKVSSTKYLGIILNEKLKWNETITSILGKVNKFKFILNKLQPFLSKTKLLLLYKSLVLSNISYGIGIYGSCPEYLMNKLQKTQNYFLKKILHCNKRHNTIDLHKLSNHLLIKDIYRLNLCILIFETINNKEKSSYLKEISTQQRNQIHSYNTRNSKLFVVDKRICRLDTVENMALKEFNSLPLSIKNTKDKKLFKADLIKFYLSKY